MRLLLPLLRARAISGFERLDRQVSRLSEGKRKKGKIAYVISVEAFFRLVFSRTAMHFSSFTTYPTCYA
jgi:hypothetical protein